MHLPKKDKIQLAQRIKEQSLKIVNDAGTDIDISGQHCRESKYQGLKILYSPPSARYDGKPADNMLDIWQEKKVFSVVWEPFKIVNFRYGEWMNIVLPDSFNIE